MFPFTAIVGQEDIKTALIVNVIDPGIGGLLVMGEKGTAKSTAVRALADLLPEMPVVRDCRFHCAPEGPFCGVCLEKRQASALVTGTMKMRVVELPLGITSSTPSPAGRSGSRWGSWPTPIATSSMWTR
jgi:magnesium chelatase subunit I